MAFYGNQLGDDTDATTLTREELLAARAADTPTPDRPQTIQLPGVSARPDWMNQALCAVPHPQWLIDHATNNGFTSVTNMFFAEGNRHRPAQAVCATCPARTDCFEYALDNDERGIWGGVTERGRTREASRRRQGHPPSIPNVTVPSPTGCGTRAAYKRHRKAGEEPCQPCRDAENAYRRQQKRRQRETLT